jgi:DNA (cytosine-5)-methyltransferase 1
MNVLDLFSGIGAFSLGLERAGMRTVAFCEIDPFCRRVLAKHWPEAPCYDDVRSLTAERLRADGIPVDVICGGFPCQDISVAGRGAGITGERSGLWREYARLIGEVGPRYVIVENVAALLGRGLGDVLGDLASLGYDAEWHCIPASAIGAPHRRDRIWIVANAKRQRVRGGGYSIASTSSRESQGETEQWQRFWPDTQSGCETMADAKGNGRSERQSQPDAGSNCACGERQGQPCGVRPDVLDANGAGLPNWRQTGQQTRTHEAGWRLALTQSERRSGPWWAVEPDVGRVAHGVASRVDRLRGLGNSLVPQIPELIGRAIMEAAA